MSKCICNDYLLSKEKVKGEFFDPDPSRYHTRDKLPKDSEGFKIRVLHFGCPKHDGNSNRRMPAGWPNISAN